MPAWSVASVPYFLYIAVLALLFRGLTQSARLRALAACAIGLGVIALSARAGDGWANRLVLPPLTLLLSYWASGQLWVGPMPRIEHRLAAFDARLGTRVLAARLPQAVIELLELSYAGVYPLIPIALLLHLQYGRTPDADHFWTVILVTDYVCFGMLPWIQTRPPRALEAQVPWHSRVRPFNIGLLAHGSIGVNTVPSGHAAEALAGALLLSDAPWPIAAWMWFNAVTISAAAVLGRYHYALDAFAGWAVALGVWAAFR